MREWGKQDRAGEEAKQSCLWLKSDFSLTPWGLWSVNGPTEPFHLDARGRAFVTVPSLAAGHSLGV